MDDIIHVQGYQLLKDGKLYGSIMPPEVHSLRIKDITLGDRVMLQILALTDHPVGRSNQDRSPTKDGDGDSGIDNSQNEGNHALQWITADTVFHWVNPNACISIHPLL